MKKILAAAVVAATAASLATVATAQDNMRANPNANVDANANVNAGPGNSDFGQAIAAMNNAKGSLSDLEGLDASTVNVVKVDTKAQGNDEQAWTNAMTRNQADIDALRTGIAGNSTIKAQLDAQNITTDQILGMRVGADGAVTVYVQ